MTILQLDLAVLRVIGLELIMATTILQFAQFTRIDNVIFYLFICMQKKTVSICTIKYTYNIKLMKIA